MEAEPGAGRARAAGRAAAADELDDDLELHVEEEEIETVEEEIRPSRKRAQMRAPRRSRR